MLGPQADAPDEVVFYAVRLVEGHFGGAVPVGCEHDLASDRVDFHRALRAREDGPAVAVVGCSCRREPTRFETAHRAVLQPQEHV